MDEFNLVDLEVIEVTIDQFRNLDTKTTASFPYI